jgi:Uma2 family endonuclease
MSAPTRIVTPAEYLAFERGEEWKHELRGGVIVEMPRLHPRHTTIVTHLIVAVGSRLKGTGNYTLSQTMRVKVPATGLYTYPDHIIMCGPAGLEDEHRDTLLNPSAIVEVFSEASEVYDRGVKFDHYRRLDSLREYVLVAQDEPLVDQFVRGSDDEWHPTRYAGLNAELVLTTVPVRVPLTEIYADVTFPEGGRRGPQPG